MQAELVSLWIQILPETFFSKNDLDDKPAISELLKEQVAAMRCLLRN